MGFVFNPLTGEFNFSSGGGSVSASGETMAAFRQRGTTPIEVWYGGGIITSNVTTNALSGNTLYLAPFVVPYAVDIDQIMFEVTTVGNTGAVARAGIYNATSKTNIYPTSLVVDGGEFATDAGGGTGVKKATIAKSLLANSLYWFAWVQNNVSPLTTIRVAQAGGCQVIGLAPTLGASAGFVGLSVAFTYAALPDPAPANMAGYSGALPVVAVRLVAS